MDFLEILILIVVGGALGGAAEFLRRFFAVDGGLVLRYGVLEEGEAADQSIAWGPAFLLMLFAMVIGVAGAIGVQFVLIILGAARLGGELPDPLFVLSISAAAGFGARQLLVRLSNRLEDQVRDAREKAAEAGHKAEEAMAGTLASSIKSLDEAQFVNSVESVIRGDAGPATTEHVMHRLADRIREDPLWGAYAIPYSFLLKQRGRTAEALAAVEAFLQAKQRAGEVDRKYGSALYNKACYLGLLFKESADPSKKRAALADLRRSLELDEDNWTYVLVDDDWEHLRQDGEFAAILSAAPDWTHKPPKA